MNKIKVPPCESAGPEGACFWAVIGTMCGFRETPAGCPRYVPASGDYPTGFDALAAAVDEAGFKIGRPIKIPMGWKIGITGGKPWRLVYFAGYGPTPTAALLAACRKYNEEAE